MTEHLCIWFRLCSVANDCDRIQQFSDKFTVRARSDSISSTMSSSVNTATLETKAIEIGNLMMAITKKSQEVSAVAVDFFSNIVFKSLTENLMGTGTGTLDLYRVWKELKFNNIIIPHFSHYLKLAQNMLQIKMSDLFASNITKKITFWFLSVLTVCVNSNIVFSTEELVKLVTDLEVTIKVIEKYLSVKDFEHGSLAQIKLLVSILRISIDFEVEAVIFQALHAQAMRAIEQRQFKYVAHSVNICLNISRVGKVCLERHGDLSLLLETKCNADYASHLSNVSFRNYDNVFYLNQSLELVLLLKKWDKQNDERTSIIFALRAWLFDSAYQRPTIH